MASLGIANLDKDLERELIAGLDQVEALLISHIQGCLLYTSDAADE